MKSDHKMFYQFILQKNFVIANNNKNNNKFSLIFFSSSSFYIYRIIFSKYKLGRQVNLIA